MTAKVDSLDRLWKPFVRAHGQCESCGKRYDLTDSHIIKCGYLKTRWDPRNNQCMCWTDCHSPYENQPIAFTDFVNKSSCGQYVDTMTVQANSMAKPDYDLWKKIFKIVKQRGYSLVESREWLGQTILLCEQDILLLE